MKSKPKIRLLVFGLLLVALLGLTVVSAGAIESSAPTITSFTPADGVSLKSSSANISFSVTDPDLIAQTGSTIKVNGTDMTPTVSFQGHEEYDSCSGDSYWVVDSYAQATISVSASGLKDGPCLIEVMALDRLGNTVEKSWTINVAAPPVFSGMSPAPYSETLSNTMVSVKVTDNNQVDSASISLKFNGATVAHSFDPTTGIISYTFPTPLSSGIYSVAVDAKDIAGNVATTSWKYNINATGITMAFANAGITFTTTEYSCFPYQNITVKATKGQLDANSLGIKVNGQPVGGTFDFKGHSEWPPYWPEPVWVIDSYYEGTVGVRIPVVKDGTNEIEVTMRDTAGNQFTKIWTFGVALKPEFSAPTPANGAQTSDFSGFSVKVTDNSAVNPATLVSKLDGTQVPASWDSVTGTVYYKPLAGLSNGSHTVNVNISDLAGNIATYSWSFAVQYTGPSITFADQGKTFSIHNPEIVMNVSTNVKLSDTTYSVKVDGQAVSANFQYKGHWDHSLEQLDWFWAIDTYNEATISFTKSLTDGNHQISITAADTVGNSSMKTFTFGINQIPLLSGFEPTNGTSISNKTPTIKAIAFDPNGPAIDKSAIKLILDNATVNASTSEAADGRLTISYTPAAQLKDDSTHSVSLTVPGAATVNWQFYISSKPDMPVINANCLTCHPTFATYHPNSCGSCHTDFNYSAGCLTCHNGNPDIPNFAHEHTIGDIQPVPLPSDPVAHHLLNDHFIDKGSCNDCHSIYLTREHNRTNKSGVQMNCDTCHKSSDPKVVAAITAKNADCTACHEAGDHELLHTGTLDSNCQTCHDASLSKEHMSHPKRLGGTDLTCDTCHKSTDINYKRSIAANNLNCAGCHKQVHKIALSDNVPSDIVLDSNFKWTTPIEAKLFNGDSSAPTGYQDGQIVISNRRSDTTAAAEWVYFNQQLSVKGWALKSPAPAADATTFSVEYQKLGRSITVNCYNRETANGLGNEIGYRVEVWYK